MGLKTAFDAAAAFMWERAVGIDLKEDPSSLKPRIEHFRPKQYHCETLQCRFHAMQDGAIDLLMDAVTDPIETWRRWREAVGRMSEEIFPHANEVLGCTILYGLLNMVFMTVLRFVKMVTLLLETGYLFFTTSFCILIWRIGTGCWKYATMKAKLLRKNAKMLRRKCVKEQREEAAAAEKEVSETEDKEDECERNEAASASKELVVANIGVSDDVFRRAWMG